MRSAGYARTTLLPHRKLDSKSKNTIFIRYIKGSKVFVIFNERADKSLTSETHNVEFIKKDFLMGVKCERIFNYIK